MSTLTGLIRPSVVILIQANDLHVKPRLKALESRCDCTYIEVTTREKLIQDFRKLAAERSYEAIVPVDVFSPGGKWNNEILKPFEGKLKLLVVPSAGYDHADVKYLSQIGVYVANCPTAVAEPTAMTAVMLILQTVRASTEAEATVRRGNWDKGLIYSDDIRDMTIGIIGNGSIGQLVQKKLQALGVGKIVYNSRRRLPPSVENGAIYKSVEDLLAESDLVTLHCPHTSETHHLLSDAQFASMKKGSYIVNTSRGPVVHEEALVRAMESGQISRVGLDVFENEPEVHPYLLRSERATLLPHWGSSTKRMLVELQNESLDNFEQWLDTGVPKTPVNKPETTSEPGQPPITS